MSDMKWAVIKADGADRIQGRLEEWIKDKGQVFIVNMSQCVHKGIVATTILYKEGNKKKVEEGDGPPCEKCGRKMALRTRRGTTDKFWGCVGYFDSSCRNTMPYEGEDKPPAVDPSEDDIPF